MEKEFYDSYVVAKLWGNDPLMYSTVVNSLEGNNEARENFRRTKEYKRVIKELKGTSKKEFLSDLEDLLLGFGLGFAAIRLIIRVRKLLK